MSKMVVVEFDLTSDELRKYGYTLKKEGRTLALYQNGGSCCVRSDILKLWNQTNDKFESKLFDKGIDKMVIATIMDNIASNYEKIATPSELLSTRQQRMQSNYSEIQMTPKAIKASCTMKEWQTTLKEKYYDNLKNETEQKIPGLWPLLEFAITMKCILNIKTITLPTIGIILGPPGALKTVTINMPKGARDTFTLDNFTPKSLVSHNSNLTEEQLQENDILPKIKNKMFLVPELSPLFTNKEEDLSNTIGMIVRIADGEGYTSATGSKGVRGYEGPIMFVLLGAAVDIPRKIHRMLSRLGPKLYFFRLSAANDDEDTILQAIQNDNYNDKTQKIKKALFDYLEYFESCPNMELDPESGIPKIRWDSTKSISNQIEAQNIIIKLSVLLAHLRGDVTTWETETTQGLNYGYGTRIVERPQRAAIQLHNLARAHALSQGREHITIEDDLPLVVKVVLSGAASMERVKVLNLLLSGQKTDWYRVEDVAKAIGTTDNTAKRVIAEFKALELVEVDETLSDVGKELIRIRLKDNFEWFFSEDFKKLKGDYEPGDFKDFLIDMTTNKKKTKKTTTTRASSSSSGNDANANSTMEDYSTESC